jgi:pimeloyl-ACP methyl ester carboxylesterase
MKTRVYCMYGLGGPIWSAGIEVVLASAIRKIPGVICPPTRRYSEWRDIVADIKATPGDKHVVIGHSMGAAAATYVTDYVPVDLVVLYDLAGMAPSKLGKNTGRAIDIYDTIPDLVPEWRVQAVSGHEHKILRWYSQHGHTWQDDSPQLAERVVAEVRRLAA